MKFTGERFHPEVIGGIALEHKHRYLHAAMYVQGKDVLDIASGEGYGSAILSNAAKSVIGVDISPEAVAHSQNKYVAHNLQFCLGSADAIPLPDASVDMVVSFETIEHHDKHEEMFLEFKRVLRPNGVLCISSPDHHEYSVIPGYQNEYHVKELTLEEFDTLLARHFTHYKRTGQRVAYGSVIAARENASEFIAWHVDSPVQSYAAGMPHALYLIALASDGELPEIFPSLLEARLEDSDLCRVLLEESQDQRNRLHNLNGEYQALNDAYQALDGEHQALDGRHQALYGEHQALNDAYQALDGRYQALYGEHQVLDGKYHDLNGEYQALNGKYHTLEDVYYALQSGFQNQVQHIESLENSLTGMLASRSWKITKPLRIVGSFIRGLKSRPRDLDKEEKNEEVNKAATQAPGTDFVQEHVASQRARQTLPDATINDVRIYVAAAGNHFFQEIARLLQSGFTDIDIRSSVVVAEAFEGCADKAHADADLHLIVAPHEFFHFIPQATAWPHAKGLNWILNTEQAHTNWFAKDRALFDKADLILNIDQEFATQLAKEGLPAESLPLGFSPNCRIFDGIAPIELNDATKGIPQRIREWTDPKGLLEVSLHDRPLSYCFFGASTERREAFFAHNASIFAKLEGYRSSIGPLGVEKNIPLSTENISSIIRRSKISLNIHQSEHRCFEWNRIILQGIWQGALVLSEPCTAAEPFRPNIDYVSVELDHLADTFEYLLFSNEGKAFAERIRRQGYATLTKQCRISKRLRELLQLYAGIL